MTAIVLKRSATKVKKVLFVFYLSHKYMDNCSSMQFLDIVVLYPSAIYVCGEKKILSCLACGRVGARRFWGDFNIFLQIQVVFKL